MANWEILILIVILDDHTDILVLAKCMRCPYALQQECNVHYFLDNWYEQSVCAALGVAAECSIDYFWDYIGQIEVKVPHWALQRNLVSRFLGIIFQLSSFFLGNLHFPQKGLS
jgi:hypothetical protein